MSDYRGVDQRGFTVSGHSAVSTMCRITEVVRLSSALRNLCSSLSSQKEVLRYTCMQICTFYIQA